MTRNLIAYIRFIHGYLFLLVLYAFGVYAAGSTWEISDTYLAWLLEATAAGGAAYLALSVLIIVLLVIRKIVYGQVRIVIPVVITVICSLIILPVYTAAEGLIVIFG